MEANMEQDLGPGTTRLGFCRGVRTPRLQNGRTRSRRKTERPKGPLMEGRRDQAWAPHAAALLTRTRNGRPTPATPRRTGGQHVERGEPAPAGQPRRPLRGSVHGDRPYKGSPQGLRGRATGAGDPWGQSFGSAG